MEKLKKSRAPIRGLITKCVHEVEQLLLAEPKDVILLKTKFEWLSELQQKIQEIDNAICEEMLADEKSTEEDQLNEAIGCEDVITKMVAARMKIGSAVSKIEREDTISETNSIGRKRQFKLPKIELQKFNGKLLDWLSWWAQFSKIHDDDELHCTDKFQYLIQSMQEGTKAADIVKGFPATADNYLKAIAALQERFGRKKLLTQVYIRELFKMGLETMNSKSSISMIYDKLICHVRSLESLNVTVEQSSLFLYPMVETSLPEDVLVAWQRSPKYEHDGSLENLPKSELDYLLEFLKQEVEREEQRSLVKTGLNNKVPQKKTEASIPTAAALHISETKFECIFCEKRHLSQECRGAGVKMSSEQKWDRIQKKNVCAKCLLPGHRPPKCRAKITCSNCSGWHYKIMCRNDEKLQAVAVVNSGSNNILSSIVILKTIM